MAQQPTETPIAPPPSSPFTTLSDDNVLNILAKLESDPRDWARISCVSPRFSSLVHSVCYPSKCSHSIPSAVSDLLPNPAAFGGEWASLYKLSVCCPGLLHAGILLENSDFGLEREIGPDESYPMTNKTLVVPPSSSPSSSNPLTPPECWSLFDDLYFDTMYDSSEAQLPTPLTDEDAITVGEEGRKRKMQWVGPLSSHLATGAWNFLSREQGNKLLASRFRGDSLYISDWPGCVHDGEKRKYMVFRGVFKNFKRSRVWRTIRDGKRGKIQLECAFCGCDETWDLHSAFCLKRVFGFHDDGEPVVRAYVCENGHVSGAWTQRPMYT